MTKKERNEALRSLWLKARMLFALMRAVWSGQVISMDVELRGSVLMDHGFWEFGMPRWWSRTYLVDYTNGTVEIGDYKGRPILYTVKHMDGVEIIQVDDDDAPENGE